LDKQSSGERTKIEKLTSFAFDDFNANVIILWTRLSQEADSTPIEVV